MKLHPLDIAIIVLYLSATIATGLLLKKRAGKNLKSYFQGGRTLPWYMLGLSNASGMFDISGTMWLVTLCFVYGLKSIWIPWLWPVFNQVFLAVFLSVWLRRSNVLTGAEWIRTRFGDSPGGRLSHIVVVVFALISVLGFLAYGFIGVGKFMEIFIPWETLAPLVPFEIAPAYVPHLYGIFFTLFATFYAIMGGMLSIVWTDVIQFSIMSAAAIAIGVIAMVKVSHADLLAATPEGWANPFFGWHLGIDWRGRIEEINTKIVSDGYSLFSIVFMMMLFKGLLVSAAGPAPNYDMQKILAARSPREGALMSGFVSVVLMPVRYFMIAGFAVLAIIYYRQLDLVSAGGVDFENILPAAISQFAPTGILGLLLAGLLAAFMSTFAATVNAAPAYLINDIYKRYINPGASNRRLIYASYLVSLLVVIFSTAIGFWVESVNSVLQWLVSGLWGGYAVANVLKWYWWRLNGMGYFWGMVAGIAGALALPPLGRNLFPSAASDIMPLYLFPLLLLISGTVCVVTSLLTRPDDENVLKEFYRTVRPWGFWGPIHAKVTAENPGFVGNGDFRRDMTNVAAGIVAQTTLVALPIFIVIKETGSIVTTLILLIASALFLKKNWFDHLEHTDTLRDEEKSPAKKTTENEIEGSYSNVGNHPRQAAE